MLGTLGFSAGVTPTTFNHYIKSLRKLGVPFEHGESGRSSGKLVKYSYNHLMELCVSTSGSLRWTSQ